MVDNQKNFNLDVEKCDISKFDYGGEINKEDVMLLDDGRCRPRDYFSVDDFYGVGVWLRDDGRLIPRKICDVVNYFEVVDGRLWVFHDGG